MQLLLALVAVVIFGGTAAEIGIKGKCSLCEFVEPLVVESGISEFIEETLCPGEELVADPGTGDCRLVTTPQM